MFPVIIATRGNAIYAAILQWNIYYNKMIWHHQTYVCTISKNYENYYSLTSIDIVMIVDIHLPSNIRYYVVIFCNNCICDIADMCENVCDIDIAYRKIA